MTCYEFRKLIETKGKIAAANAAGESWVVDESGADMVIMLYVLKLLDANEYKGAAVVLWGDRIFNPRPMSVKGIWDAIESNALVLLQGCGGVGKTLTPICWLLLDWIRDPQFTNVKLISATKGHAASNAFSDMVRMHRSACIKLPGEITSDYIGLDNKEKKSGISVVAIPMGDDGRGRLQGFHPHPRPTTHPTLGDESRVRAFMDECITIPIGVWEGVDNMKVSLHGKDSVKIIGSYNPKDQTSITAQNAEPADGWDAFDVETGVQGRDSWKSKEGWAVLRIDGKKTENVRTGKYIFPGLITRDGYRNLEQKNGGNSVDYYVMARGAFPPEGAIGVMISSKIWGDAKGEFLFVGNTVNVAGVDVAVDGRDNCVLTKGRTGLASSFRSVKGQLIKFSKPRQVLQIDQQFTLRKGLTKIVGDEIMATCKLLNISPENLCIDSTGNGSAVFAYVAAEWSNDVQGVDFNKAAGTIKILEEDKYLPEELYDGVNSEVWFALSRWLEFLYVAIAPTVRKNPLEAEILGRRYVLGAAKKMRVEKKDDYCKRLAKPSPDFADSLTICLHGTRCRGSMMGSMSPDRPVAPPKKVKAHHGRMDTAIEYLSI